MLSSGNTQGGWGVKRRRRHLCVGQRAVAVLDGQVLLVLERVRDLPAHKPFGTFELYERWCIMVVYNGPNQMSSSTPTKRHLIHRKGGEKTAAPERRAGFPALITAPLPTVPCQPTFELYTMWRPTAQYTSAPRGRPVKHLNKRRGFLGLNTAPSFSRRWESKRPAPVCPYLQLYTRRRGHGPL